MYSISSLIDSLPQIGSAAMLSYGYGVWMVWQGDLSESVTEQFPQYGGMLMRSSSNQALLYFSTTHAFEFLGRLKNWSKFRPMPLFIEVFPSKLLVDTKLEISLSVPMTLSKQQVDSPNEFLCLVYPTLKEKVEMQSGVHLNLGGVPFGVAEMPWRILGADPQFAFDSTLGWYFVIKATMRHEDRNFFEGWKAYTAKIMDIVGRMGLKVLAREDFILVSLDNFSLLRAWCYEILTLLDMVKSGVKTGHWPSVMALMEKRGLPMADNLLERFSLDWARLTPDVPHMPYRTAFLLGKGFQIHHIAKSTKQGNLDDQCNISLVSGEGQSIQGHFDIDLPRVMISGNHPSCFYCGMRNHLAGECPSRQIPTFTFDTWLHVAAINYDDFNQGMAQVDGTLVGGSWEQLLSSEGGGRVLGQAMMDINAPAQLRFLNLIWRAKGKDWPEGILQSSDPEGEPYWAAFEALLANNLPLVDRNLELAILQYPRHYHPRALQGFLSLERGEYKLVHKHWAEAEKLCYTTLQRAYFIYLQARFNEFEGQYEKAISRYQDIIKLIRNFMDAKYRVCVCLSKMGFVDQAISMIRELVLEDEHIFNRVLIDHEMEKAHPKLVNSLWKPFEEAKARALEDKKHFEDLERRTKEWFEEKNPIYRRVMQRLNRAKNYVDKENYAAFQILSHSIADLEQLIEEGMANDVKDLKELANQHLEVLREIQKDSSWFPFRRMLRRFNHTFNLCAERISALREMDLMVPEEFKRAKGYMIEAEELIVDLKKQLVGLMLARDAVLFGLFFGKTFMWAELFSVLLSLLLIPGLIYLGQKTGQNFWITEKWTIQTIMLIFLSLLAVAFAAIRTTMTFQRKKERILESKR